MPEAASKALSQEYEEAWERAELVGPQQSDDGDAQDEGGDDTPT